MCSTRGPGERRQPRCRHLRAIRPGAGGRHGPENQQLTVASVGSTAPPRCSDAGAAPHRLRALPRLPRSSHRRCQPRRCAENRPGEPCRFGGDLEEVWRRLGFVCPDPAARAHIARRADENGPSQPFPIARCSCGAPRDVRRDTVQTDPREWSGRFPGLTPPSTAPFLHPERDARLGAAPMSRTAVRMRHLAGVARNPARQQVPAGGRAWDWPRRTRTFISGSKVRRPAIGRGASAPREHRGESESNQIAYGVTSRAARRPTRPGESRARCRPSRAVVPRRSA